MATTTLSSARSDARTIVASEGQALFRYLMSALVVAGLSELLLLRTLSRVGVHVPKEGVVLRVYSLLTGIGSLAFNLSTVLALVALLAALGLLLWRRPAIAFTGTASAMAVLMLWSVLFAVSGQSELSRLAFGVTAMAVLLLLAIPYCLSKQESPSRQAFVALVVVSYLCSQYYALAHEAAALAGLTSLPPLVTASLALGEGLVILNGLVLALAWGEEWRRPGRGRRLSLSLATALALVLLLSYWGNGSTSAILALWTEGLTFYLPFPLYLVSFWLYLATALTLLRGRDTFLIGGALLLLFVAGYMLETTNQYLLAMLAVLILTQSADLQNATKEQARERSLQNV